MSDEALCSSCEQQKNELFPVKSVLVGSQLYMCKTCMDNKFEPRWAIIMAGRTLGIKSIRSYIVDRRYVGEDIKAYEVIQSR